MSTLIRSASLTNFAEIAQQLHLDPQALIRQVGLPLKSLNDPDLKVETNAVVQLLELAAQMAHEPAFGLKMGESRRLSNLGLLGMLLRDEPTLGDVLNVLVRHIRMHNEALIVAMDEADDTVVIKVELAVDPSSPLRQSVELAMAVTYRTISFSWAPSGIRAWFASPTHHLQHGTCTGAYLEKPLHSIRNSMACYAICPTCTSRTPVPTP